MFGNYIGSHEAYGVQSVYLQELKFVTFGVGEPKPDS